MRAIDEPYSLRWFINKCYKRIQKTVEGAAFKSGFDFEDLMSEMHIKLGLMLNSTNEYDFQNDEERFMAYVYTMARNTSINESRAKRNQLIERSEEALTFASNYKHNQSRQPDMDLKDFTSELRVFVNVIAAKMPKHYKVCFEEYFYNQKKYEEIARIACVPLSLVKTSIHRMRDLIKQEFGNRYNHLFKEG